MTRDEAIAKAREKLQALRDRCLKDRPPPAPPPKHFSEKAEKDDQEDLWPGEAPPKQAAPVAQRPAAWFIDLTPEQLARAEAVAQARLRRVHGRGLHDWSGRPEARGLDRELGGTACELGFSLLTGLPWDDGIEGKRPDVGPFFVRSTKYPQGSLLLHAAGPTRPNPDPKQIDTPGIYVLGIGERATWRYVGWATVPDVLARAAWAPMYADTAPCWWVAQKDLEPMDNLPLK